MLESCSYEERLNFYKMLKHTPIVVISYDSKIKEEIKNQYLGEVNPHIKEEKSNLGEYDKQEAEGAFVSEVLLDNNLNIVEKKQFIYVKELNTEKIYNDKDRKRVELFGTGINVSHLIHELGHAWVSEKDSYRIEDGKLIQRCGTAELISELISNGDGTYTKKNISNEGLMLEEAINTTQELKTIARYLEINKDECEKLYKIDGCFIPSVYQGTMSSMAEYLLDTPLKKELVNWRINGNRRDLERINSIMSQTKQYENREEENEYEKVKNEIYENSKGESVEEFLENCKKDFFPDKKNMTPIQIIENSLTQCYDISVNKYYFNVFSEESMKKYSGLLKSSMAQGYRIINGTIDLLKEKNLEEK